MSEVELCCPGLGSLRCRVRDLGTLLGSALIKESGPPEAGRGRSSSEVQLLLRPQLIHWEPGRCMACKSYFGIWGKGAAGPLTPQILFRGITLSKTAHSFSWGQVLRRNHRKLSVGRPAGRWNERQVLLRVRDRSLAGDQSLLGHCLFKRCFGEMLSVRISGCTWECYFEHSLHLALFWSEINKSVDFDVRSLLNFAEGRTHSKGSFHKNLSKGTMKNPSGFWSCIWTKNAQVQYQTRKEWEPPYTSPRKSA